jgi:FkbM family methyltransferase
MDDKQLKNIKIQEYNGREISIQDIITDNDDFQKFKSLYNDHNSWLSAVFQFLGQRESKIGDFAGDGDVMVDLGAHIGLFSIMFNRQFKRIYSFEPLDKHFNVLVPMVSNFKNILPIKSVVSTITGMVPFFIDNVNNTQTSLVQHIHSGQAQYIDSINLNDFLKIFKVDTIDFLKVDIEGFELYLFCSESFDMCSDKIKKMHIECHNIEKGPHIMDWKTNQDFITKKINSLGFKTIIDGDEIFASKI